MDDIPGTVLSKTKPMTPAVNMLVLKRTVMIWSTTGEPVEMTLRFSFIHCDMT